MRSAFFVLGAIHVLNPDAFIVKTNLALMREGREFDPSYTRELSTDAIPALIEGLRDMPLAVRCEVGSDIHYRYRQLGQDNDIRSLNYSRRRAWRWRRANDSLLHQTDGCPPQLSNDADPERYSD